MLLTATEARKIADEVRKAGRVSKTELVLDRDKMEEFDYISQVIEHEYNLGKIECDFDFSISDRSAEILKSFLYIVRREGKTIVGW